MTGMSKHVYKLKLVVCFLKIAVLLLYSQPHINNESHIDIKRLLVVVIMLSYHAY